MSKSKKKFISIGKVEDVKLINRSVSLRFNRGKGKVSIYSSKLIRFILTPLNEFDLDYSYAIIKQLKDWKEPPYNIDNNSEKILLNTDDLIVEINKNPYKVIIRQKKENGMVLCEDSGKGMGACFNIKKSNVRSYKKIQDKAHYFGFGEKTGHLDKRGKSLIMHSRYLPYRRNSDPLYQSHPFFISICGGIAYGIFFDNISKTTFDMGKTEKSEYYFDAEAGELNYYFIYGPTIDDILEIYTELTGHMEMPPKWAIGYHQCRDSYKSEKHVKKVALKFRTNKVPCDGIWLDIFYMDGFRCFTFNKNSFPNPKRLMEELKGSGFKPIIIVDPGIKVDEKYDIYKEMIENKYFTSKKDGTPSKGIVWPGLTIFPDFTREDVREWWAEKNNYYLDLGILGIWNDMNEPCLSVNPVLSLVKRLHLKNMYLDNQGRHSNIRDAQNIYGFCEAWSTWTSFKKYQPNLRPFILTRSGYSGIQRYAAIWTGDNWSDWKNITLAIRMLLNLNLSAQSFVGSDIGGFFGLISYFLRDKKQFIRWIQSGVFYPFCRVHSYCKTKERDPFLYGKKVQKIAEKYIKLRYELFPYWYNLFYEAHRKGKPIIRPLFYSTPNDKNCFEKLFENEFFVGNDILIIPIDKRRIKSKLIYLPEGCWIHYWSLKEYKGKQEHLIPVDLKDIPIFIRKGAIIPTQPVIEYVGQKTIEKLILKIFKGEKSTSTSIIIYEDDGISIDYKEKGGFFLLEMNCEYEENEIKLKMSKSKGNLLPSWKFIILLIYDKGKLMKEEKIEYNFKRPLEIKISLN